MVGELSCFLGLQIKQRKEDIFITQEKYAKDLVKKIGLDNSQQKRTPAATHVKNTKVDEDFTDHKLYRSMIVILLYLTASRPDIAYVVGIYAQFQSDPRVSHLATVKRIIKYVHGCSYDKKSTSGGCFFLGNNLISWFSKKKNCVSLSTAEAGYIAAGSGCTQLIWMKQMLQEYSIQTGYYDTLL
ncbi:putative mitochondrial protein [Cucumis melo var. makuwa]|uniref:Mitochondrial protein n=1 Tax=Cucumis melo var. makuwa TaxID=1194695 RepID=A0A5D3CA84_CUCMM|nr:putative mitochondrial protein [Cucumis melo var. makuwa]TYK08917.1 putative mitochondrial protein [Cucumis melo var. makuwa]